MMSLLLDAHRGRNRFLPAVAMKRLREKHPQARLIRTPKVL